MLMKHVALLNVACNVRCQSKGKTRNANISWEARKLGELLLAEKLGNWEELLLAERPGG